MTSKIKKRIHHSIAALALALGIALPTLAVAEKTELTDEVLGEIYGQALIDLTTTDDVVNGFQFTRIGFGAEGTINANLRNVQLGQYADPAFPAGPNGDIDISAFQLGRLDAGRPVGTELVGITNPYIEVAYRNIGNDATREFIGLRVGFEGIRGDIGVILNAVSGSVLATDALGALAVDFNARRQTSVEFPALAEIDVLRAGDAAGASRDFWLSLQKVSLTWPALVPATDLTAPANNIAQAGFWLNWRDRLQAVDVAAGHAPPNNNLNY